LTEVRTISLQELELIFNEPLMQQEAENIANYTVNESVKPTTASITEAGTVRLTFPPTIRNGDNLIRIGGLTDMYGNKLTYPVEREFDFVLPAVLPGYNELLITEIMADESPVVGLPAQEYLELYNPTEKVLTLQGIRYTDATSTTSFPN